MSYQLLQIDIEKETGLQTSVAVNQDQLLQLLTSHIQSLINNNTERLIFILYRIDINEQLIKKLIALNADNAAETIAIAILKRQLEKIEIRKLYTNFNVTTDEELW